MAKKPGTGPQAMKARAARTAAAVTPSSALAAEAKPAKKRTNVYQFFKEVRAEMRKITWTTKKETWITSVMVFIMVARSATFFFFVDLGMSASVNAFLKLANPGS